MRSANLRRSAPLLIAAVFLGGCARTRPVHYYTLGSFTPPATQHRPGGPTILVANIVTAESLQDGRIRYRTGTNEVGAYEYHRWLERPGTLVQVELIRALRASGKYQHVRQAASAVAGDYVVQGRLFEFDEVDTPAMHTRISLHMELVDKRNNRFWDRMFEREEPVDGKEIANVVQSMDRNLRAVVSEVSAAIDSAIEPRP